MNKPVKTKLCWNCEGNVSRSAENCPYCAVYLSPDNDDLADEPAPVKAPYKADKAKLNKEVPKAPYGPLNPTEEEKELDVQEAALSKSVTNFQTTFLPLIFLTTGLIFLFFAAMLLLFSENGKLTLQWDGDYWYAYGILALPLLFLGWKYLESADSN